MECRNLAGHHHGGHFLLRRCPRRKHRRNSSGMAYPQKVRSMKVALLKSRFIGLILLPLVGNAAEHVTSVWMACKGKMELTIGVAVGSSIQIAAGMIPLLVIIAWPLQKNLTLFFVSPPTFFVAILFPFCVFIPIVAFRYLPSRVLRYTPLVHCLLHVGQVAIVLLTVTRPTSKRSSFSSPYS